MAKTVLIVEDDLDIRDPLRELLEEEGYKVECASTGLEALQMLQTSRPNIILFDLMIPIMSGIELIQTLRDEHNKVATVVVILSAAAHAEKTASDLGVGFIRKPINIDVLLATVHQYCA